jgi:uncharacterized protein (DUF58 family)
MADALPPWWKPRQRLQRWFESRLPLSDTVTLTQRNVYVLPSGAGGMLTATLLVLLVASINYQLNLGYLLTFLLAGSAVVALHVGHAALRGLTLHLPPPTPAFAGQPVVLDVSLTNPGRSARYGIWVAVQEHPTQGSWCDVPPGGSSTVQVAFAPQRRGRHRVPTLLVETRYPLGTTRCWTVWRPAADVLVYPAPEPHAPPLPPGEPHGGGAQAVRRHDSGEFEGVRAYRRGDPLKLVVWKKMAKSDQLVSRDTVHVQATQLWLDPASAGSADGSLEGRLSRLCAWVLRADDEGVDYGLRLGATTIAPDHGTAHRLRCLEALALC